MNKEEIESLFKKYKVRIPKEKQGQSECYECKRHHKYSLTWTSFLYEYKENYYCFEHIVNILLQQENQELKKQQEEFINYMMNTIENITHDETDDEEIKGYLIQRGNTFKEILSKYKKIIGGKDEIK